MKHREVFLDCTLRDGGYYNNWDFDPALIEQYLVAMKASGVDVVELGFRFFKNDGFRGACAFTTDAFIRSLDIPEGLTIGVMINAGDVVVDGELSTARLEKLIPVPAAESPVELVRFACHIHQFEAALPASNWLTERGYKVGFNLMQIADRSPEEIERLATVSSDFPLEVLYFADSMGSLSADQTEAIVNALRAGWKGALGIHTHDNRGLALSNTLRALDAGVTWVDATVTGMGRGPGNGRTEEVAIELAERRGVELDVIPLMKLVSKAFRPMQLSYGWGTNPYYFLAGKHGIHPTFIQEMLADSRYDAEDIVAVIDHLRREGGKKFSPGSLESARHFFRGEPVGSWRPSELMEGREVLLLGTGPGVAAHREALESFIDRHRPVVLALNTQSAISADRIDVRAACHPVRLLADGRVHRELPQPLIAPASMLPANVKEALGDAKTLYDFGLAVEEGSFAFGETECTAPNSLVVAYAMAIITSGKASRVFMAGFDGYTSDDPRTVEMRTLLETYEQTKGALELTSITPTRYGLPCRSVYGL